MTVSRPFWACIASIRSLCVSALIAVGHFSSKMMSNGLGLQKLIGQLSALNPGDTARITNQVLVATEIADIAEVELKARAQWLERQLPFRCDIKEAIDGLAFIFRRSGHDPKRSPRGGL